MSSPVTVQRCRTLTRAYILLLLILVFPSVQVSGQGFGEPPGAVRPQVIMEEPPPAYRESGAAPAAPLEFTSVTQVESETVPPTAPTTAPSATVPATSVPSNTSAPFTVPPPPGASRLQFGTGVPPASNQTLPPPPSQPSYPNIPPDRGPIGMPPPRASETGTLPTPPEVRFAEHGATTAAAGLPETPPQYPSTPPPPENSNTPAPQSGSHALLMFGLLFSLALNAFLIWITWDTYNRYQDLVEDLDELERRRHATRPQREPEPGPSSRDYLRPARGDVSLESPAA